MLRAFFEAGMKMPDEKVLELLSKAFDFTLDSILYRGDRRVAKSEMTASVVQAKSSTASLKKICASSSFRKSRYGKTRMRFD